MPRHLPALLGASLLLGVSTLAAQAQMVEPTTPWATTGIPSRRPRGSGSQSGALTPARSGT